MTVLNIAEKGIQLPMEVTHSGKNRSGIKKPEKNQEITKINRKIPRAFGVQKAVRLIKNRQEKLISQLKNKVTAIGIMAVEVGQYKS